MKRMRVQPSAVRLLLAVALVVPLAAACGPSPAPTDRPPTATALPSPTPEPVPTETPEPTVEPTPVPVARYRSGPCLFDLPYGQVESETVECGTLEVLEDRSDPQSRTIRLAVAIFHPAEKAEPDPVVYLSGGPGGSALELMQYTFTELFQPVLAASRDLVVFDQRGVGLSKPALDCPGLRSLALELLDERIDGVRVEEDAALAMIQDAALDCRQDLAKEADLSDYHTAASAADVEDLRRALGYEQVNLWGTSYGTWLALETMRRYPDSIRSVVLDAVYPPDVDLLAETPTNAARSIDLLFAACAADEACSTAYPDLEGVYRDSVERLNLEPASFQASNPISGDTYDVLMTGDNLSTILFQALYATSIIPSLPQVLYDASEGEYNVLARLMGSMLAQGIAMSHGQQFSVLCHDEVAFGSAERFREALADHPELKRAFEDSVLGDLGVQMCSDWQVGQADATLTQAVASDVPTLIMSGEFDPITPPAWGSHVAETLGKGHAYEFPGVGHGASAVAGCPQEMMVTFLQDPSAPPDSACIEQMKNWAFVVPTEATAVELEPFSSDLFGIEGVLPKGWSETPQPGVYARGESGTDVVALIQQAAVMTASDLLSLLTEQLSLGTAPTSTGQRQANGLVWSLYAVEVQGLSMDLALAESGGKALLVVMQCYPDERDALYENVFLPVIDALVLQQ